MPVLLLHGPMPDEPQRLGPSCLDQRLRPNAGGNRRVMNDPEATACRASG